MTAGTKQTNPVRRERRIIERPRLIKMLDESDARVILLLAPAGYGKTTLARQWAKTLNGAIWVTLTTAHRDVVTFAEDIGLGLAQLGDQESTAFIRKYVRARSNPQRAAREVGIALSERIRAARTQWLVLDDYHELSGSRDIDELVRVVIAAHRRSYPDRDQDEASLGDLAEQALRRAPRDRSTTARDERERIHPIGRRGADREQLVAQAQRLASGPRPCRRNGRHTDAGTAVHATLRIPRRGSIPISLAIASGSVAGACLSCRIFPPLS